MKSRLLKFFLIPVIFLIVSLFTLKDYGISWDEPIHFYRGQAYLHYFLTGEKNYTKFPKILTHLYRRVGVTPKNADQYQTKNDVRRSYYQNDDLTFEYWMKNDGGHPVINDELAALSNYIFYQKLGIMGDIESLHLFNILASTLLVLIVSVFSYQVAGSFASIVSALAMAMYPLFFAESKFNIKDPPEVAFFALCIWSFWMSLKRGNWKWLLLSVLSFSFAFGVKFNVLFIPVILLPYLIIRYFGEIKKGIRNILVNLKKVSIKYWIVFFLAPVIVVAIFYVSWPYLWQDPIVNFLKIFGYYKEIGTGFDYQPGYYLGKFNLYPALWILITTPPVIILLFVVGFVTLFKNKDKEKTPLLWLLWFLIPVIRVTIPGSSIYGGVRQVMEYIPAMALISGLGASFFVKKFNNTLVKSILLISIFIGLLIPIIKYYPNENVYFNFIIGGLHGAKEKNIPYWGNSFGNAYWQAIQWLNENAPKDSTFGLIQATALSLPRPMLRDDLGYWNGYWSGIKRNGEYLMELTYNNPVRVYEYAWNYVDKMLIPVYEVKVDGVAIAKIWKNDKGHTREEFKNGESLYTKPLKIKKTNNQIIATSPENVRLSRFVIEYNDNKSCTPPKGSISYSLDSKNWFNMGEPVPFSQMNSEDTISNGKFTYYFTAEEAKQVRFTASDNNSCLLNIKKVSFLVFK